MKIYLSHLRQSFGEVKGSNSSRVTVKTGGLPGGLSHMSGGLSQMSRRLSQVSGGGLNNQSSIKQVGNSLLHSARESQQVCSRHFLGVLIWNFQDILLDLISTSPQPDKHMMGQMDTNNHYKRVLMKDGPEEQEEEAEEEMMDESCIFCGSEPKAGTVHLTLLHKVQVFKISINISKI